MDDDVFVLDNMEQLNITRAQAALLTEAELIYNPDPDNLAYFTTAPGVTLDDVENHLHGRPTTRSSIDSLDDAFWAGAPSQAEAYERLHGHPERTN